MTTSEHQMREICPRRGLQIPVMRLGRGLVYGREYLPHDWREAITPQYDICGACGKIRKRQEGATA